MQNDTRSDFEKYHLVLTKIKTNTTMTENGLVEDTKIHRLGIKKIITQLEDGKLVIRTSSRNNRYMLTKQGESAMETLKHMEGKLWTPVSKE